MYLCTDVLMTFSNKVLTVKENLNMEVLRGDWNNQDTLKGSKCSLT